MTIRPAGTGSKRRSSRRASIRSRSPRRAGEVAELGVDLAAAANPTLRGDALAGVLIAESAAAAAAALVEINLKGHPREDMVARARDASGRAAAARATALGSADDRAAS